MLSSYDHILLHSFFLHFNSFFKKTVIARYPIFECGCAELPFFLFCYTIRELTTTSSALHLIQMTYDHSCFVIGTSKKTTYLNVSFIASTINITDFYYFSPDEYLPDIIKYASSTLTRHLFSLQLNG